MRSLRTLNPSYGMWATDVDKRNACQALVSMNLINLNQNPITAITWLFQIHHKMLCTYFIEIMLGNSSLFPNGDVYSIVSTKICGKQFLTYFIFSDPVSLTFLCRI